jgi:hypothetical protein
MSSQLNYISNIRGLGRFYQALNKNLDNQYVNNALRRFFDRQANSLLLLAPGTCRIIVKFRAIDVLQQSQILLNFPTSCGGFCCRFRQFAFD